LHFRLIHHWPNDAIEIRTKERLLQRDYHHIVIDYDGSSRAAGFKLYINGKLTEVNVVRDHLTGSFQTASALQIGNKKLGNPFKGQIDDLRFYNRELTPTEVETLAIHLPIRALLAAAQLPTPDKPQPGGDSQASDKPPAANKLPAGDKPQASDRPQAANKPPAGDKPLVGDAP